MIQTTIFDAIYPKFKIDKPIRLIELFGGYGSQALALKYLGIEFEHWKLVEWAVKSIQAYKDIHFENDNTDYSKQYSKEYLIDYLHYKGISANYNDPMDKSQIKRLSEEQIRNIYNNIQATHNLVNIQQVKGEDLEIKDTDKYCYMMTYSFPCQDLSLAGKGKGMKDNSTRSGLLWEVERILTECKSGGVIPQILLMENVPQVHGEGNVEDFNKWQLRLEELGYKNYWQDLIATDYGIPQTRNRCFMVSILGDYSYSFPPKQELKLKLKDMLEDNVDEKYYLSDKTLEQISNWKSYQNPLDSVMGKESISPTITTRIAESQDGGINASMKVYCDELQETTSIRIKNAQQIGYIEKGTGQHQSNTIYDGEKISPCLNASDYKEPVKILIKNATSKGYLEATDGDGVDISGRMEYHRGTVQKQKAQTISTMGGEDVGVVINMKQELCNNLIKNNEVKENDVIRHNYTSSKNGVCVQTNNEVPTLDTRCDCLGVVTLGNYSPSNHEASRIIDSNYSAPTIKENHGTINATQTNDLRIRKLTPKECFRLQGVKDEDYEKVAKNQSNASLYHLAGDSIVVNVIEAIIKQLI